MIKEYKTFKEFYPYYLEEHSNRTCRIMHYIGTTLVIVTILLAIVDRNYKILFFAPLFGYGFAWIGHFIFEKNRPATFKYPLYSFMADWVMYFEMLTFTRL